MFSCFFFKHKTAYEMRISDWSSDVCSSDLAANAMVIPMPPSVIDFASTVSFIDMARTTMAQLERLGGRAKPAYNFIKIVASRVDDSKSMHREILSMKLVRASCRERVCQYV